MGILEQILAAVLRIEELLRAAQSPARPTSISVTYRNTVNPIPTSRS
jgi:hypothetical protein